MMKRLFWYLAKSWRRALKGPLGSFEKLPRFGFGHQEGPSEGAASLDLMNGVEMENELKIHL